MRIRPLLPLAALLLAPACDGSPTTPPPPLSSYRVAVLRPQASGKADIVLMNADGTGATSLFNTPDAEYHPSWSPDGRRLVFTRAPDSRPESHNLWTIGADGSGATQLTFPAEHPGEHISHPAWSPDGSRIAYIQDMRLYMMDADGRNRRPVGTAAVGAVIGMSWSPDGSRLAIERRRAVENYEWEIATLGADGSGLRVLTPAGANDYWPAWSPDGTKIAYGTDVQGTRVLSVMNADGSGRRMLSTSPGQARVTPSWSPDGLWLAYVSFEQSVGGEAIVLRPDGTDPHSLGQANYGAVAWRP